MTGRERMLKALRFEEPDRPPHFEMWFQLTREAFGVEHPPYPGSLTRADKDRLLEQGMDIAEVKRLTYGKMALMGNVRCDTLQHGTPEQIRESEEYALMHGSPGGGYIFSSSNTIFDGVPLANYEYMVEVYRTFQYSHGDRS